MLQRKGAAGNQTAFKLVHQYSEIVYKAVDKLHISVSESHLLETTSLAYDKQNDMCRCNCAARAKR